MTNLLALADRVEKRPIGLIPPHPQRKPHFCNDMTRTVHVGNNAYMTIINPYFDSGIEWQMRYGNSETCRLVAASLLESYDYLLSSEISTKESVRRLRIMRSARRQLRDEALRIGGEDV